MKAFCIGALQQLKGCLCQWGKLIAVSIVPACTALTLQYNRPNCSEVWQHSETNVEDLIFINAPCWQATENLSSSGEKNSLVFQIRSDLS